MSGTFAFHNIYTTKNEVENIQTVLHEGNESGEGTMRRFEVAPGIQITYNDLKMDSVSAPSDLKKTFCRSIIVLRAAMNVNWKVAQSAF